MNTKIKNLVKAEEQHTNARQQCWDEQNVLWTLDELYDTALVTLRDMLLTDKDPEMEFLRGIVKAYQKHETKLAGTKNIEAQKHKALATKTKKTLNIYAGKLLVVPTLEGYVLVRVWDGRHMYLDNFKVCMSVKHLARFTPTRGDLGVPAERQVFKINLRDVYNKDILPLEEAYEAGWISDKGYADTQMKILSELDDVA